jgi:hypothetical protein
VDVLSSEEKRRFLRALSEDEEFRYAVAGLLGLGAVLDELRKLREDFNKHIEQEEKRWRENEKRWEANERRWREAFKRFEAIEAELARLREDFNRLYVQVNRRLDSFERRLIALGARWGVESEETFREAMKGVLEEILGTAEVEKWRVYDEKGEVLGFPAYVEADVLVRDNVHVLIEVKASVSEGDVVKFWRIGRLYERLVGVKPELVIVSPFVDEKSIETAKRLNVRVYTGT